MSIIKRVSGFFSQRAEYKRAVKQLCSMTDRELSDIGINRSDIHDVVRQDMQRKSR